jgi:hypothetical protein
LPSWLSHWPFLTPRLILNEVSVGEVSEATEALEDMVEALADTEADLEVVGVVKEDGGADRLRDNNLRTIMNLL